MRDQIPTAYGSALEAIGNTPPIELARLTRGTVGRILARLEHLNPEFSKKDRIARQIMAAAEAGGRLAPSQTAAVLACDSGLKYRPISGRVDGPGCPAPSPAGRSRARGSPFNRFPGGSMRRTKGYRISMTAGLLLALLGGCLLPALAGQAHGSLRRNAVVEAVRNVSPAVVNISTLIKERATLGFPFAGEEFFRDFFPDFFSREYTRTSLGSGVILDGGRGYIVTNYHVVSRAAEIKVITAGKQEYEARVLGTDPRSDLALLKVEARERLPEIPMGRSDDLLIGETVIAIGNPFGLSHTVTTGVVSAIDRSVRSGDRVYRAFIQTDASINPGNSGGPLLNIDGQVIGINSAIYQKAQGIGFAIPIDKVKRIVHELVQSGEVRFPWLGLEVQELSPALRGHFSFPEDREGVLVRDVIPKSPAAGAGLQRGDVITHLGPSPVASPADFDELLGEYLVGETIRLLISRKGETREVAVEAGVFSPDMALETVERRLGIQVGPLDADLRRRLGVQGGVAIEKVRPESEAGRIGLQAGDLILGVNRVPIENLDDFRQAIALQHHHRVIMLLVRRGANAYSLKLPF